MGFFFLSARILFHIFVCVPKQRRRFAKGEGGGGEIVKGRVFGDYFDSEKNLNNIHYIALHTTYTEAGKKVGGLGIGKCNGEYAR